MAKKAVKPSELEFHILQVLWEAQQREELPLPVREVRSRLELQGRELAHTSVITILEIMVKKGLVKRTKRKNANFYRPTVERSAIEKQELGDLLGRVFNGSPEKLMLSLLDSKRLDEEDLQEIKRLISAYESKDAKRS